MSEINYQALREAAEKATWGDWDSYKPHRGARGYEVRLSSQAIAQHVLKNNAEFIAAFNPKIALALLDERERNQQYIKSRDQENEDIALTVGKLRVELEGKDSKIANLTAERDALREGEMGDARHSNTRAAADIYFQLVEECEIPAGGSLVEYVDDMREKLEAAENNLIDSECHVAELEEALRDKQALLEASEKRIAEQQSAIIAPGIMRCAGCGFVLTKNSINMAAGTITAGDSKTEPCPNGCGPLWPVTWKEQALQMRDDSEQWFIELQQAKNRIAELEEREILLPERSSMLHRTDFHDDYQTVMAYKVSEVIAAIRAAGIRIKGE
ncbi:ead/Ea22-like family protein [Escherichia coli]|uniref:ead/Ea22-like family protein n=1 Tax=Escherichia coli TaxID=562 RepID=UPI00287B8525|nr:ead/Ea22-like family protein [Escherichia coli]